MPPLDPDYDPLATLIRRSEAVLAEQTVVVAAAVAQASTAEAATRALALKRAAPHRLIPLRHGLFRCADTGQLVEAERAMTSRDAEPRQTRGP